MEELVPRELAKMEPPGRLGKEPKGVSEEQTLGLTVKEPSALVGKEAKELTDEET